MSKIKNGGLDQYGTGPFEPQQFGAAGVEGVNVGLLSSPPNTRNSAGDETPERDIRGHHRGP